MEMPLSADDFRRRIKNLGLSNPEAARRLGLTLSGLHHQTHGLRKVSKQTELLLGYVEKECFARRRAQEKRERNEPAPDPCGDAEAPP
jgi:hypothetical protein